MGVGGYMFSVLFGAGIRRVALSPAVEYGFSYKLRRFMTVVTITKLPSNGVGGGRRGQKDKKKEKFGLGGGRGGDYLVNSACSHLAVSEDCPGAPRACPALEILTYPGGRNNCSRSISKGSPVGRRILAFRYLRNHLLVTVGGGEGCFPFS